MALSNTATPRYYGEFRDAVLRGEIPVNREISMEMNRIDDLIANPNIYYDDKAIDGFIKYCEMELTLTDGGDLYLLDSFKLWSEQIFGWYYFVERSVYQPGKAGEPGAYIKKLIKKRLTTKQYLIVARGAAKSMYAACIQAYFLNVDTATTHQVTTAPTMKQADEVMSPIRTAITRSRGPLLKFLTEGSIRNTSGSTAERVKLASTKKGVENFLTGSLLEVRPMAINKLQGLRPKISTIDEWLSGDIREDVIGALEQGASKMDDFLILAISSEGTVRNGSGDTVKMELASILKGDYQAPHISIWHYKLDQLEEAKAVDTPKVTKFVEGLTNPNLHTIESTKNLTKEDPDIPHSPVVSLDVPDFAIADPIDTTALKQGIDDVWDQGPDRSLAFGGPMNPEAELSFYNNPEIDPEERRQAKEEHKKRATKAAKLISKTSVHLEPAKAKEVTLVPASASTEDIDTDSGFGSGNLASILASQSSSRKLVRKRKVKK